jgi:hypothetical protein
MKLFYWGEFGSDVVVVGWKKEFKMKVELRVGLFMNSWI